MKNEFFFKLLLFNFEFHLAYLLCCSGLLLIICDTYCYIIFMQIFWKYFFRFLLGFINFQAVEIGLSKKCVYYFLAGYVIFLYFCIFFILVKSLSTRNRCFWFLLNCAKLCRITLSWVQKLIIHRFWPCGTFLKSPRFDIFWVCIRHIFLIFSFFNGTLKLLLYYFFYFQNPLA